MWPFVIEINFKLTFFREYFNKYMYNMITISRFQSYSMKRLYRKTIHFLFFQIASIFKVFLVYFIQNSDQRNIALIFIITIQTSHLFNIGDHSQFFLSVEQNLIFLYLSMWFYRCDFQVFNRIDVFDMNSRFRWRSSPQRDRLRREFPLFAGRSTMGCSQRRLQLILWVDNGGGVWGRIFLRQYNKGLRRSMRGLSDSTLHVHYGSRQKRLLRWLASRV